MWLVIVINIFKHPVALNILLINLGQTKVYNKYLNDRIKIFKYC